MSMSTLRRLWREEGAQDLAEYALLLALLAVVIVPILLTFGDTIVDVFDHNERCLRPALGGGTPADGSDSFGQCKKG
jgi:Flp pilus assembly pilin Flp